MNEDIFIELTKTYNKLINKYGEDRILWVAAAGQSLPEAGSMLPRATSACYLPTQQELYLTYPNIKEDVIDIRLLKDNLNKLILSPYKYINPKYEELLTNVLFTNQDIFTDDKALYNAIYTVANMSFDVPSNEQELIEKLSKTETIILNNIIKEFNGFNEGDIRVSYYSEQWNISTSVFRTLFYKLKEYKVAEIDSRGVKGTHIKFTNFKTLYLLLEKVK